jgi:starch phosphorylase
MKFMMNGALTIGTLDGANVEMHQQLGDENIFLFGLTADEVAQVRNGYRSMDYYYHNNDLKRVIDQISAGFSDGVSYADLTNRLLYGAGGSMADEYLLLADFDSYSDAHRRALEVYKNREQWNRMSLINIARSGIFAADRSISDYARDIWNVPTR